MTREQKINTIVKEIRNKMGAGYKVESQNVLKNNDVELTGITILADGETVAPNIYIDKLIYDDVDDIASYVIRTYESNKNHLGSLDVADIVIYFEKVKDLLSIRLIGKSLNEKMLRNIPYENFLDMAIIATINLTSESTIKVTNKLLNIWNKTFEEILPIAKRNFYSSGLEFVSMTSMIAEMIRVDESEMEDANLPMYVVTNKSRMYGSAYITSNLAMQDIAGTLQSDLIVIPSSVHEVIVMPLDDTTNYDDISETVQDVNGNHLSPDEVLSNHVYIYRRKTGWEVE